MTNNEHIIALARRLVACPGFHWLPGMRETGGSRVHAIETRSGRFALWHWHPMRGTSDARADALPDRSDPLTRLGVLQLVREAWGDPRAHVEPDDDGQWCCWLTGSGSASGHVASEAEALVAALEAAPLR